MMIFVGNRNYVLEKISDKETEFCISNEQTDNYLYIESEEELVELIILLDKAKIILKKEKGKMRCSKYRKDNK